MSTFESWLTQYKQPALRPTEVSAAWVDYASRDQLLEFLQTIAEQTPQDAGRQRMLNAALGRFVRRAAEAHLAADEELVKWIDEAYQGLGEDSHDRFQLL